MWCMIRFCRYLVQLLMNIRTSRLLITSEVVSSTKSQQSSQAQNFKSREYWSKLYPIFCIQIRYWPFSVVTSPSMLRGLTPRLPYCGDIIVHFVTRSISIFYICSAVLECSMFTISPSIFSQQMVINIFLNLSQIQEFRIMHLHTDNCDQRSNKECVCKIFTFKLQLTWNKVKEWHL